MSEPLSAEIPARNTKLPTFTCEPPSYQRYKYSKLPSPDSIRLVQRHDHNGTGPFHCSLHTYKIDIAPNYTALSYSWGQPAAPGLEDTDLDMFDFHLVCDDYIHPITTNLYMALRRLTGTLFWIDQISINQEDDEEKASQVARMGTIFAKAQGVYVWLGEQNQADEIVFDIIRSFVPAWSKALEDDRVDGGYVKFGDPTFWQTIGLEAWTDEQVTAIIQFFNRSWFRRTWIIQEIALADKTVVACGGMSLSWRFLRSFSFFLSQSTWAETFLEKMLSQEDLKPLAGNGVEDDSLKLPVGSIPTALGRLQDFCNERYSRGIREDGKNEQGTTPSSSQNFEFYRLLESFILIFRYSFATWGEDKVFAPLAITSQLLTTEDTRAKFFLPSYGVGKVETYTNVCKAIIEGTKSLSVLSQVADHSLESTPGLPSWVPDFSITSLPGLAMGYSSDEIPLEPVFNAFKGLDTTRTTLPDPHVSGTELHVQGIIWDTIRERGPNSEAEAFNRQPLTWLRMCRYLDPRYLHGRPRAEAFWRTMICDLSHNNKTPAPVELGQAFFAFLIHRIVTSGIVNNLVSVQNVEIDDENELDPETWSILDDLAADYDHSAMQSGTSSSLDQGNINATAQIPSAVPTMALLRRILRLFRTRNVTELRTLIPDFSQRVDSYHKVFARVRPFRRLFLTSRQNGVLGHGPVSLAEGDVVAFLAGSSVPMVLRRVDGGNQDGQGDTGKDGDRARYRLVGETYVHGLMCGEAMCSIDGKEVEFRDLCLI